MTTLRYILTANGRTIVHGTVDRADRGAIVKACEIMGSMVAAHVGPAPSIPWPNEGDVVATIDPWAMSFWRILGNPAVDDVMSLRIGHLYFTVQVCARKRNA